MAEESSSATAGPRGHSIALSLKVSNLDRIDAALAGIPRVTERHTTFYGMEELTVREPSGALVAFAMRRAGGR